MTRKQVIAFAACLALSSIAFAQSTGTINGRVTDPSGAPVPGAAVVVTNTQTGVVRNSMTNAEGLYSVPALQSGEYNVKVEVQGFAATTKQGVTVVTDTALTIDIPLSLAGTKEQVTVEAGAQQVETTQSEVSGSVRLNEVENLPMINRNFTGMAAIIPGARQAPITNQTKGAAQQNGISVGGGRGIGINTSVDGQDNKDDITGGPLQSFTMEGIQEFKLIAHQYGAQYGRSSGGALVIVTKSGTNNLHGSGFAIGRNDSMTAIDYFTKTSPFHLPKTSYNREQYGGSLGGPIIKDKWFWFGAAENINQEYFLTPTPTAISEINILQQQLAKLNLPNVIPVTSIPQPYSDLQYTLKTDYHINDKQSLFVRWAQQWNSIQNDVIGANHPDLSVPESNEQKYWSFVGGHTWVLNSATVNQLTVARNYSTVSQAAGANTFQNPTATVVPVTGSLTFPDVTTGRAGGTDGYYFQHKWQFKDDFSHQAGAHALKFGVDFAFYPKLDIFVNVQTGGGVTFFQDPSVIAAQAGCVPQVAGDPNCKYPQGFSTPGIVASISQGTASAGGPPVDTNIPGAKQLGLYAQDDWRVARNFTLNLGVRWDKDINMFDSGDLAKSRVLTVLQAIHSQYAGVPQPPNNMFSPRIGFAWDIGGNAKNVIRGGLGMYWDESLQGNVWNALAFGKPSFLAVTTFTNSDTTGSANVNNQLPNYVLGGKLPLSPPAVSTVLTPGTTGRWLAPDYSVPRNYQFHLGYQRQLASNQVFTFDSIYIHGLNEFRAQEINPKENAWDPSDCTVPVQPAPNSEYSFTDCPMANRIVPYGTRRLAPLMAAAGMPGILGSIQVQKTNNRSRDIEEIFHYETRFSKVTFQATYTLGWASGFGGSIGAIGGGGTPTPAPVNQDNFFGPGEWGPAITDERHRVVLAGVFNVKWGIQFSPIMQAASARPYTLTQGTDINLDGVTGDRYIDPATGQPVAANSQRGDPLFNLDLRVSKTFNLWSEKRKANFFAEFYNLTNRANFGNLFQGNKVSKLFEQPGGPGQFGTGYLAGLPTSRQLQLGLRITF